MTLINKYFSKKTISKIFYFFFRRSFRIIIDYNIRIPKKILSRKISYKFYNKEEIIRKYIINNNFKIKKNFLDFGSVKGDLNYLLGISQNLNFNLDYKKNLEYFNKNYLYFSIDKKKSRKKNHFFHDLCVNNINTKYNKYKSYFDVVYSNNVFNHLTKPWVAAKNFLYFLKKGGIGVIAVPFSIRYQGSPIDCYRFSHTGLAYLFKNYSKIRIIENGYDIIGRRNDWNGTGKHKDYVPNDSFGGWRENWFTILIFKKI